MWNRDASVAYLDKHANGDKSLGRCAEFVRKAVEAGGVHLTHHTSAKDYGSSLEAAMFRVLPDGQTTFVAGDVAVIQPITGHPHGHMTMFDGKCWVSDFVQHHGMYPGHAYRLLKPPFKVYRYGIMFVAPPTTGAAARAGRYA